MKIADKIIKEIENFSLRPVENKKLLKKYIQESIRDNSLITFYNWECPPRTLKKDALGKTYVNYDVDLESLFQGKRIDPYIEIPRVVGEYERELKQLNFLKSLGLNFRFVKIIADTNAYYITPESFRLVSKKRTKAIFDKFKSKIEAQLENSYSQFDTEVILFSQLMKKFKNNYEKSVTEFFKKNGQLISQAVWKEQLVRTQEHIGLEKEESIEFSKRVIATYAAEGIVFDRLSRDETFPNCVWLNIEEVDRRTIQITNCLRREKGIGKLPMLFLV